MADGEITIQRSLEQIQQGITDIGTASRAIDKDLRAVQAGLKFDPTNTELLAQKQELLSQKLENSTARADELRAAIAELNRIKAENGQLTDGQVKLLATYEQQLKSTSAEVTGLTGATQRQTEANVTAAESTKSFSQSMTEFQSKMRAVNQVMSGVIGTFEIFGGDKNSAMGKVLTQAQSGIQIMTQFASVGKLLGKSNSDLAKTFGTVAMAAGTAIAAYSFGTSIIDAFGEENRKVVAPIMIAVGALGALAVAGLAAAGVLSWGTAVPIITAAIGVGVAGMTALLKKETENLQTATSEFGTTNISTPSVPSYTGGTVSGGGGTTYISQGGLTESQAEMAFYRGGMRTISASGIIDILESIARNGGGDFNFRRFFDAGFNDLQDVNNRRTRGFATK